MVLPGRDIGKFKESGYTRGTQLGKYSVYFAAVGSLIGVLCFAVGLSIGRDRYQQSTFYKWGQVVDDWAEKRRNKIQEDYYKRIQKHQQYFDNPPDGERPV